MKILRSKVVATEVQDIMSEDVSWEDSDDGQPLASHLL